MKIKELKRVISEGLVSAEAENALAELIGSRQDGEFSTAEEGKVREILELEVELLDAKAEFYEELVSGVNKFEEELEKTEGPNFSALIDEFRSSEKKQLESLDKSINEKINLLTAAIR